MAEVYGIPVRDLPAGWVALDVVVLVKGLNADGQVRYAEVATASLSPVECIGMATTFIDTCREYLVRGQRSH